MKLSCQSEKEQNFFQRYVLSAVAYVCRWRAADKSVAAVSFLDQRLAAAIKIRRSVCQARVCAQAGVPL